MDDNDIIDADIIDAEIIDSDETEKKPSRLTGIAKFVVGSSVKFVVAGAVAKLAPEPVTRVQRAKLIVGSYVISDMAARSTKGYVEEKVESWRTDIEAFRTIVKSIEVIDNRNV